MQSPPLASPVAPSSRQAFLLSTVCGPRLWSRGLRSEAESVSISQIRMQLLSLNLDAEGILHEEQIRLGKQASQNLRAADT